MSSPVKRLALSVKVCTFLGLLCVGLTKSEVICSAKINVGFALDGSNYIGKENFASAIKFAANVSDYLDVDTSNTWIFLVYGNQKRVFKTKSDLSSLTPENQQFPNTTEVHLGTILGAVREQFSEEGSQRGAVDVVVVIASHRSVDDIAVPAVLFKKSNVTSFALGVGSRYSVGQLKEIASGPDDKHFIALSTWKAVNEILAKNMARKICQVVDSCVSSPCYNGGSCTKWKGGYNCSCSVEFYGDHCEKSRSVEYLSLGCFNDDSQSPALLSMESENATFLDGPYQSRKNAIRKCALEAAKNDFKVFALQSGGKCFSGSDVDSSYSMYGSTNCPQGGKGGHLVNEVYLLGAKCGNMLRDSLIHLSKATIRGSAYKGSWDIPLIDGNYSWCPADSVASPYLEVSLGKDVYLTKFSVQGKTDSAYSADNVCANYSIDGRVTPGNSSCTLFEQHLSGKSGNYIHSHTESPPLLVQSIRLASSSNNNDGKCMRTEFEGCVATVTDGEEVIKGCYSTERNKCCVFPFWYQGHETYSCIRDNHNQPWCATSDNYDRDELWDNCQGISSPCDTAPCLNGGVCVENLENWSYQCTCSKDLTNENCQDDYDECFNSPCQNGATCVNTFGGYRCECNHGYSGKNCHLDCSYNEIELGFVVDGSSSVEAYGNSNFQMMKNFIKQVIRSFDVSSGATRVGAIVYSTNATVVFKLDQYSSYEEVEEAVDGMPYPGGGTHTGKALKMAANTLYSSGLVRGNVPKVLLVITDGVSTDDVTQSATLLNTNGVLVYVVAIGQDIDHAQLTQIAHGKAENVFTAEFHSLGIVSNDIRGAICKEADSCSNNPCHFNGACKDGGANCTCAAGFRGDRCSEDVKECSESVISCGSGKKCTEAFGGYECTCADATMYGDNCDKDCTKESTILFLLDSSHNVGEDNIKRQVEFIITVTLTLSFSNIGVISYATDAHYLIRPGQPSSLSEFAHTLRTANYSLGKYKNLGKALIKSSEETKLFSDSKAGIVVAMITGKSEDEHAVPAAVLQQKHVTIIGLVLTTNYSMSQLNLLVTNPNEEHILQSGFVDLKHFAGTTRNAICKAANPCSSNECSASQICVNKYGEDGGFQCIADSCSLNPCKNGGNCTVDGIGSYSCACPEGIGGKNCTEDILNECDSGPCINGGTCKDHLGKFECECPNDYSGRQCELACVTQKFNLVFVLDGSGSIESQGKGNFQRSKDFIIEMVRSFTIGKDDTNVALVLYSKKAQVVFKLDKYYKTDDIVQAIEKMSYPNGGTKTGYALDKVRKDVFKKIKKDRESVPKVVLVLTDGLSQDDVEDPAKELRDEGATIISLGVGCCYDDQELKAMATDPDEQHVFEVSFSALSEIKGLVREQICTAIDFCSSNPCQNGGRCISLPSEFQCVCAPGWQGKDCGTDVDECAASISLCPENQVCQNFPGGSTCLCTSNRYGENCTTQCKYSQVDVAFLLDSSGSINSAGKHNYQIMKDFIKGIVRSFIIGPNDTTVAVATFSSLHKFRIHFDFTTYSTTAEIVDAIQNVPYSDGYTFTGNALGRVKRELFPLARAGVPHILIVLTDGRAHDSVRDPAKNLRDMGVHIISVGVGDADYQELKEIASDPDDENVFTTSFDSIVNLAGSILEDVCKVVDHCLGSPCSNNGTCRNGLNGYNCTCLTGFMGKNCEEVDHCSNSPCRNSGTCHNLAMNFTCECAARFKGKNCEEIDYCYDSPCTNNGTCHNNMHNYTCDCPIGFTGQNCEEIDHCYNNPCVNNGSCINSAVSYQCSCLAGFIGGNCERTDHCHDNPCANNGSCVNSADSYQCSCLAGFSGENCETMDHCFNSPCQNNGTCQNLSDNYTCDCLDQFTGHNCEVMDHCYNSPCQNNGTCHNHLENYTCTCLKEFTGQNCEVRNHCQSSPCQHSGTCENLPDSYKCDCPPGSSGLNCEAMDYCYNSPCQNNGTCRNLLDNYTCDCPDHFTGHNCEVMDHCYNSPCQNNGTCHNRLENYTCTCLKEFTGQNCEVRNHCQSSPCQHNGTCENLPDSYTCDCPAGSSGLNCEAMDYCYNSPCQNNGTCHHHSDNYTCDCPNHFTGHNCEVMDYCYNSPCQNNGTCHNHLENYTCSCLEEFTGQNCEVRNHCQSSPCQHNGTCENLPNNYTCDCTQGSSGINCEAMDYCYSSPCQNNGTCRNLLDNYTCDCLDHFTGHNCEAMDYCFNSPCQNNGTCRHLFDNYTCDCPTQFIGHNCEVMDHCFDSPCQNNGTCHNHLENYTCTCLDEFTGQNCEVRNHCQSSPCQHNGTCENLPDSYTCHCPAGTSGLNCEAIDYCYNSPCQNNGTCGNLLDNYTCDCPDHFTGHNCEVKYHCYDSPCQNNGTCHNNLENYTCGCLEEFTGQNCEVRNHCYNSPCQNNGTCENLPENYTCTCFPGFTGQNCEAVDNCNDSPCLNNGTCMHLQDSFSCKCAKGFTGLICQDVDHCYNIPCKNNATCHSLSNDYSCDCLAGFTGKSCEEVDHCSDNPCKNNGTCDNLSHDYNCSCSGKFRGRNCEEVDHCYNDPCLNNGTCTNSADSYHCYCLHGFTGQNCEVEDFCVSQPCKNGGMCLTDKDYYKCVCPTGLKGTHCEEDVDECFNNPCLHNAYSCKNTFGSYECNCVSNYTGIHCQIGIMTNVFDLAFLFDGSTYLGFDHFHQTLLLAKTLLSNYNISQEQTNVAAAVYASNISIGFNFTEHYSSSAVAGAIENLQFLDETPLNVEITLRVVGERIFTTDRENVPDVLVIFVSYTLSGNFTRIAQDLRDKGIKIIAIGVGNSFDIEQLKKMADHVITISYNDLDVMDGSVGGAVSEAVDPCGSFPCQHGGSCSGTDSNFTCSCPLGFKGPTCEQDINECTTHISNCTHGKQCINTWGGYQCLCTGGHYGSSCQYEFSTKLDLTVLVDGSLVVTKETFLYFIYFTKAITASLNVSKDETRVSVAVFGDDPMLMFDFDDLYNQSSLEHAIDRIAYPASVQSNLGEALVHLASDLYNISDSRPNVPKVLVILTASKSHDDITAVSHLLLEYYNVTVFTIAVGDQYSLGQLKEISSDPDRDHVLTFDSGKDISFQVAFFKDKLGQALDPCSGNPCQNGTCNSLENGYTCTCYPGYSGMNCDKADDPCNPDPCKNDGTCQVLPLNSYYCACSAGWTGANCEADIKECSLPYKICQNGGTCEERMGDYFCNCAMGYAGKNCDKVFKETFIDLVFMIDGSSIPHQIAKIINVVKFILNYLPDANTRVGVVLYTSEATTMSNFNFTRRQTLQALHNISSLPTGTLIGKSLNYTRQHFFTDSRPNVHRVLVVFTDSTSNDAVSVASKLLHDMNVTILVVALGDWYDIGQVESAASYPHSNTVLLTTYVQLVNISWMVHEMICEAVDHCYSNPCINNGTCYNSLHGYQCSCPDGFTGTHCEEEIDYCALNNTCPAGQICISRIGSHDCVCPEGFYGKHCDKGCNNTIDLVFLADGTKNVKMGQFKKILQFIKNSAKVFHVSKQGTHVSLVLYGDNSETIFNLNDHFSQTDLNHALSKIKLPKKKKRFVGKGLKHVQDDVFEKHGRSGVPKVIILLQNDKSKDGIEDISQKIRKDGVKIFAVGYGNKKVKGQLKEISSKPASLYYKSTRYSELKTAYFVEHVKDSVCMALNPCSSSPCLNNGRCISKKDDFMCVCPQGYSGSVCDQEISPCFPNPCENDGQCNPSGGSYTCNCKAGFTSENCQDDINECDSDPCVNNGVCKNTPGSYHCVCPQGYLGVNCQSVCKRNKFNLAFLVDGSASMKSLNSSAASQYKNLIKTVVDFYKVDKDDTNVGLVVYSSLTITKFTFGTYYSKSDINKVIDTMDYPENATYTGAGLEAVQNNLFGHARSGMHNCLVAVTDGVSNDDVALPSGHLKAMKVVTLAVGVGEYYAAEELQQIASKPSHVFEAPVYDELPNTANKIKESLCNAVDHCFSNPCSNGGTCQSLLDTYECTCPSGYTGVSCEMDINECTNVVCRERELCINFPGTSFCNCRPGFFNKTSSCRQEYSSGFNVGFVLYSGEDIDEYDKGNFKKQVEFVKGIVKTLKDDGDDTTVGIITYSDNPQVKHRFGKNTTHVEFGAVLDNLNMTEKGRKIGKALEVARTELFNRSNRHGNNKKQDILVVLTDGKSDDDLAVPSFALKQDNVTIFSVGIGRYSRGQLNEMASEPNSKHVFTIPNYDGLGPTMSQLKDAIVEEVDPCSMTPCSNGATCLNLPEGNYTCTCRPGWTGKQCEVPGSPCELLSNPCHNNGNCTIKDDGSPHCECATGWNGTNCKHDIDECAQNPCRNDGECVNTPGGYQCKCPVKFIGEHCQTRCEGQYVNVGFLIDGSSSMELSGNGHFNKTLKFVKGLIKYLDVSKERAHVGLTIFSSDVYQVFNFDDYYNSTEAIAAMDNVSFPNQGRHIGKALNYVRHNMFSSSKLRKDVSNYLVFLTTGSSYDLIRTPARALRDRNVTIFAIGVGDDFDEDELREISGDDDGDLVYGTTFDGLEDLKKELKRQICLLEDQGKCNSSPCVNGGTCINTGRSYRCDCSRGYHGRQCQFGCGFRELGLKVPSNRRIPDRDITASSQRVDGRAAYRGRIGVETMGAWEDGWCASQTDTAPYFQVFFGYLTNVSVIETEGVTDGSTNTWVKSYYVSMSNSSETESFVNYTEQGDTKVFKANDNIEGKNVSLHGTWAHYIRIHPVGYSGSSACLRIALYGCDSEDFPSSGVLLQRGDEPPVDKGVFDTRLAVIPVILFVALLGGSLFFFIRSLRNRSFMIKQNKGYTTVDSPEDDGIYQTIPFDMPMYEVQTVAIEIGPEKTVASNGSGFWNEAYCSYSSEGDDEHYQDLNEEPLYENLTSVQQSGYEVQTLTVEVSETEVVAGEVLSETGFYESVSTDVKRKQGIYELPRFQNLFEEDDDEDDEDGDEEEEQDYGEYEDIYDNVFFPEAPTDEVKRRTLRISPEETAEDGIFSYENKIFGFDRRTTTLEETQRKKSRIYPFI